MKIKQRHIPGIGALVDSLFSCLPFISFINFVFIAIVTYSEIHPYLKTNIPWMQMWSFLLLLTAATLILMFVVYKFVLPSLWAFRGQQMFGFESKVLDELRVIKDKLAGRVIDKSLPVVAVSGGFDPIHPGHIRYIEEAAKLASKLVVILTRDEQLIDKDNQLGNPKKRKPIPYDVRKAVIEWGLGERGIVVPNLDKDITSVKSIGKYAREYNVGVFAKGGNTWDTDNLPEKVVCDEMGVKIVFGVGGYDKPYSSSKM